MAAPRSRRIILNKQAAFACISTTSVDAIQVLRHPQKGSAIPEPYRAHTARVSPPGDD